MVDACRVTMMPWPSQSLASSSSSRGPFYGQHHVARASRAGMQPADPCCTEVIRLGWCAGKTSTYCVLKSTKYFLGSRKGVSEDRERRD